MFCIDASELAQMVARYCEDTVDSESEKEKWGDDGSAVASDIYWLNGETFNYLI